MSNPLTNSKYHKNLVAQYWVAKDRFSDLKARGCEFTPQGREAFSQFMRLEVLLNGF